MAHISKSEVQEKRRLVSALCKEYGIQATVSGSNSSTLTVTIRKGQIDFLGNYADTVDTYPTNNQQQKDNALFYKKRGHMTVNHYCIDWQFTGSALDFMMELLQTMKIGHYDNSDIMTDYFNCAWYIGINIGAWDNPYILTA